MDIPAKPEENFFGINEGKVNAMQETADIIFRPPEKNREDQDPQSPQVTDNAAFRPEGAEKTLNGKDNDQKLDDLKDKVTKDMQKVQGAVWRYMDDVYRKTIYKTGMFMAAGTKTLDQAIDMATKDFLNAGINCIEYKTGRRVNIASYAEMALRTASQRATFLAEGKLRDQWGVHTVFVSAHANTCSKCAPWQGRVLVDDVFSHGTAEEAKELGVPLLSEAMKAGLLHPNCRHTLATYFPGVTMLPAVPDEKKAKENYEAEQMQRAIERKIRKWKRIAEGAAQGATVKLANDKLFELHKMMKEHLEHHPEIRRTPNREKTRGLTEKNPEVSVVKAAKTDIMKSGNIVRAYIDSGRVNTKINADKQGRHIKSSDKYIEGRSYLYGEIGEVQKLVDDLQGTGEPVFKPSGEWNNKEKVVSDKPIGVNVDPLGEEQETRKATIHYSKTGTHVVPRKEN
ncbi:phage minor capsid protein [Lacrimispora indolis]|uniref:phage minor capsid protein n=1 Tax=Lacrimispora indolis TaxID=69825 RepID=UPI001FA6D3C2|nr:phage minor capsid protein [Lacrimispora indolis]